MMNESFWGEPISIYTRQQAIEDGVLVYVTELAKQSGFTIPVVLTAALWATCQEGAAGPEAAQERVRDVLWMAYLRV